MFWSKKKKILEEVISALAESWDDEFKAEEIAKQLEQFNKKGVAKHLEMLLREMPPTKIDDLLVRTFLKFGGKQAVSILEKLVENPKTSPDLLNTIYSHLDKRKKARVRRMISDLKRYKEWCEKWDDPNRPGYTLPDAPDSPINEPDITLYHLVVSGDKEAIPTLEEWEKDYPWTRIGIVYAKEGIEGIKRLYEESPEIRPEIFYHITWSKELSLKCKELFERSLTNAENENESRSALNYGEVVYDQLQGKEKGRFRTLLAMVAWKLLQKELEKFPNIEDVLQKGESHKLGIFYYLQGLARLGDKPVIPVIKSYLTQLEKQLVGPPQHIQIPPFSYEDVREGTVSEKTYQDFLKNFEPYKDISVVKIKIHNAVIYEIQGLRKMLKVLGVENKKPVKNTKRVGYSKKKR